MIGRILGVVLWVLKLPIRLVLLPFRALSTLFSLVTYAILLAAIGGVVYLFVL
ncbi:MAG: hypothetical protein ABEH66_07715 [Halobacteriales archaeon]